jgi:hypothetical protein
MGRPTDTTLYRWGYEHDPTCSTHHEEVWLDRYRTLLRYHAKHRHTHNDARLTRYAHRTEST